jgi:hypothetical protein
MGGGCREAQRLFSDGEQQTRFICEIIYGQRRHIRFSILTTDPKTLPKDGTWYIMTNLEGKIEKTIGNTRRVCAHGSNMA